MKFYSSNAAILSFIIVIFLNSCAGLSKTNTRDVPVNAQREPGKMSKKVEGLL